MPRRTLTSVLGRERPALLGKLRPAPHPVPPGAVALCLAMDGLDSVDEDLPAGLLPESIARSVGNRRIAFIAGRLCAEAALSRLGSAAAIPIGPGGEPYWPAGIVGSITHTEALACAVAAPISTCAGIGIDSEIVPDAAGRAAIERVCLTERERATWRADPTGIAATLIFSAKEAFYKAIYPRVLRYVDFKDVEVIELDWIRGEVRLRPDPARSGARDLPELGCRFAVRDAAVHTCVATPTAGPA